MTTKLKQNKISILFLVVVVAGFAICVTAPATANEDKTNESLAGMASDEALVMHVDDDAPDGGDGSEEHPFNDLNTAFGRAVAPQPIEIYIAEGEYLSNEDMQGMFLSVTSNEPVIIRGAGMGKTILRGMVTLGSRTDARFTISDLSIVLPYGSDEEPTSAMLVQDVTLEVANILVEADYGIRTFCGIYDFARRPPCPTSKVEQSIFRYTTVGFGSPPHSGGNYAGSATIDQSTFVNTMPKKHFMYGVAHTIEYIDSTAVAISRESAISNSVLNGLQGVYLFDSGWGVEISDSLVDGNITKLDPGQHDPTTLNMVVVDEIEFMDDYGRLPQDSPAVDVSTRVTEPDGSAGDWGAWGGENPIGQTVWATLNLTKNEAGAQYNLDMHKMFVDGDLNVSVQVSRPDWEMAADTETGVSFYVGISDDKPTLVHVKATVTYDDGGQTIVERVDCFNCHEYYLPVVNN